MNLANISCVCVLCVLHEPIFEVFVEVTDVKLWANDSNFMSDKQKILKQILPSSFLSHFSLHIFGGRFSLYATDVFPLYTVRDVLINEKILQN